MNNKTCWTCSKVKIVTDSFGKKHCKCHEMSPTWFIPVFWQLPCYVPFPDLPLFKELEK